MLPTSRNDRLRAALASLLALGPSLAMAETVGTAGAANTRSAGKVLGRTPKLIEIGDQVVRDEKIETSATGSVQVVFIDRTTLNIGPNSSLIIDRFVYNPATSTGDMALTLGRGVLRLVGGQATHTGGATVNTPVATIGVRGGIATISHCPAHARCQPAGTLAVDDFGILTVSAGGVTEEVLRPGFGVRVAAEAGATPGTPTRISQADIDSANTLLTSRGTQKGGSSRTPTDAIAQADGLGGYNQTTTANSVSRQAQTSAAVLTASALRAADLVHSVQGTIQQGVTQAAVTATPPPVTQVQPSAYALMTTAGAGSAIPFLTASFAASGQAYISPVYGYRAGGPSNGPVDVPASPQFGGLQASNPSRNFQASLVIDGTGPTQKSTLAVMTSVIAGISAPGQSSPTFVQTGQFRATGRGNNPISTLIPLFAEGGVSSTTNAPLAVASVPAGATGLPNGAFPISQNSLTINSATATASAVANAAVDDVAGSYTYGQTLSPVATPAGLGSNHPDEVLQGYVGAIGQSLVTSGQITSGAPLPTFIVTNQSNSPGDISITLYGNSSRLAAEFSIRNATAVGASGELQSADLRFGEPPSTATTIYQAGQSAYVDLTHFAALEQRVVSNSGVADTSTINGKPVALSNLTLVNAASVNAASFFPGVSFCQCDYTQWGLWSMLAVDSNTTFDATGIGFWVAGLPAATSDINSAIANNVTATYNGHVIAAIANGPNNPLRAQFPSQYIAAGNFTNTVNFGARTGSINVPNLDGASYAGTVALGANPTLFAGTLLGSFGSRVMSVNGSFFQGATSPYGEMGGNVAVTGRNYLASGIFAAKKQ